MPHCAARARLFGRRVTGPRLLDSRKLRRFVDAVVPLSKRPRLVLRKIEERPGCGRMVLLIVVPYSVEGRLHTEGGGGTPYGATKLPEDRASYSQDPKTSPLHGHWAGEWLRSRQESVANQLESSASRLILQILSVSILVSVFCRLVFDRRQALGV